MKPVSGLSLLLTTIFVLAGCAPASPTAQPTQIPSATAPIITTSILTPVITDTPSPSTTPTPLDTLEPVQVMETLQPLIKEPMNCEVPCFWGIIPGKTHLDEARDFFSRLGFIASEGMDRNSPSSGMYVYGIEYNSGSGYPSSVVLFSSGNLVDDIIVDPDIPTPKEGSPREWIAFSPETLIRRYGSPSRVAFTVGQGPNIGINMIMYFDSSDLIVHYSGYNMNPQRFCPLKAPFENVRLWIGPNPPDTPSFDTVPLEKATSLTVDEFASLMTGPPDKACIALKDEAFYP